MNIKSKLILFYINKLIIVLSTFGIIVFGIMVVADPALWLKWLLFACISFLIFILAKILYIIRKSKFPVAGKDYF